LRQQDVVVDMKSISFGSMKPSLGSGTM